MGSNFNCSYMALSSSRYLLFSKFIPIRHIIKKIKSKSSTQKFELNDIWLSNFQTFKIICNTAISYEL